MLEIVFLIAGIVVGMNIRQELLVAKYNRTLEQVDRDVRADLEYYKNLSESLRQDLVWAKSKRNDIHNK